MSSQSEHARFCHLRSDYSGAYHPAHRPGRRLAYLPLRMVQKDDAYRDRSCRNRAAMAAMSSSAIISHNLESRAMIIAAGTGR